MARLKIDRPHSTSVQNGVNDNPIITNKTFILQDNPDKTVSLIGNYFVLDMGLGIEVADFLSNLTPDLEQFFVLPSGWSKRVFKDLETMKSIPIQAGVVYFLDLPDYAQTLIVSKENEGTSLTIQNCKGYNTAISLADWDFLMDVADRTTALETEVEKNAADIATLQTEVAKNTSDIQENTEDINTNAGNILNRTVNEPTNNWFPQNDSGTYSLGNTIQNTASTILIEEGAQVEFAIPEFKGYGGDIYIDVWSKGTGLLSAEINGITLIDKQSSSEESYINNTSYVKDNILAAGELSLILKADEGSLEIQLGNSFMPSFFQFISGGSGVKDLQFDTSNNELILTTSSNAELTADLTPLLDKANLYTDEQIAELGNIITIKGLVPSTADLPTTGNNIGDVWFVGNPDDPNATLEEYIWLGDAGWKKIATITQTVNISDGFIGKVHQCISQITNNLALIPADGRILSRSDYPEYYEYCKSSPDSSINLLVVDADNVRVQNMSAAYLRCAGTQGGYEEFDPGDVIGDMIKNHQHTTDIGSHGHTVRGGSARVTGGYTGLGTLTGNDENGSNSSSIAYTNIGTKTSGNPLSGGGVETRPFSIVVNFYVQVKNYTAGRSYIIADPAGGVVYKLGDMIKINSKIYVANTETTWTGVLTSDWSVYGGGELVAITDGQVGMIQSFAGSIDDPSWHELDGSTLLRTQYQDYYTWCSESPDPLISALIVDNDHVKVPAANDGRYLRNSGGNGLNPGQLQGDAIRNITGAIEDPNYSLFWSGQSGKDPTLTGVFGSNGAKRPCAEASGGGIQEFSQLDFDASRIVPTDVENRPLSMTVKYYIKVLKTTSGRSDIIAAPLLGMQYAVNDMILFSGIIYRCVNTTVWNNAINADWTVYPSATVPSNFMIKYTKTGLNQNIAVNTSFNLSSALSNSTIITANIDPSRFTIANTNLRFPDFSAYKDYSIAIRLSGQLDASANQNREFFLSLQRSDGSIISSNNIIKLTDNLLDKRTAVFETYTLNANDPFITGGIKLVVINPNATSSTITLTGFEILIKGR